MIGRIWNWSGKMFGLQEELHALCGEGFSRRFDAPLLAGILLNGAFLRFPSLNAFELSFDNSGSLWRRMLAGAPTPSADTLARGLEKFDVAGFRSLVFNVNHKLRRTKAFDTAAASSRLMVAAVDGHEMFASEKRCCPACQTRKKTLAAWK